MHSLLLFATDSRAISVESLQRIFRSVSGFGEVRYNPIPSIPIEADFAEGDGSTIVDLSDDSTTISIQGTSGAALSAAFILQRHLDMPLRIIDTDYSFDLILQDYARLEDLQAAIRKAQES